MSDPYPPITDTMTEYLFLFDLWAVSPPWERRKLKARMSELVGEMLCG